MNAGSDKLWQAGKWKVLAEWLDYAELLQPDGSEEHKDDEDGNGDGDSDDPAEGH